MRASQPVATRSFRLSNLTASALMALGMLSTSAQADSALGTDTLLGNGLVPTGQNPSLRLGNSAIGSFRPGGSRTPTGLRYEVPPALPPLRDGSGGWQYSLSVEAGVWGGDGGLANPAFRQYRDWNNGLAMTWFSLEAERAADATHFSLAGSNLGRRDQFIGLEYGRYSDFSVEVFLNQIPHALGEGPNYFLGAGSDKLTLPASLTPAGSTLAAVEAAANAGAVHQFEVRRDRAGIRLERKLSSRWSMYTAYTLERRTGTRPMGGAQFFPLPVGPAVVGGMTELIEPIDQRTHDVSARLSYVGQRTQFNLIASASLFENNDASLTWENPFNVGSVTGPNPYAANLSRGQMALAPSNQAYMLKAELAHSVPEWSRARFNATVSVGRMQQNEDLLAPSINATGRGGVPIPAPGMSWNYADWSTTDALSRRSADARIDNTLIDLNASFVPADRWTVRGKIRHSQTRNHTDYTAFNPITGEYGYLALGGGQGTVVPLETGIVTAASPLWHYRSIPFEGSQTNFRAEADWRMRNTTTLNLSYERENFRRKHRERDRTHDDRIKLGVSERGIGEGGTLRASYEYADRGGSAYNSDPYHEFYGTDLPGMVDPGIPHTVDEMRKYDLADRRQHTLNLRFNYAVHADVDAGITLQHRRIEWGAQFGRIDNQQHESVNLDLSWTPADGTTGYAFFSHDRSRIAQANVNDAAAGIVGPSNIGGSVYPFANVWSANSRDRTNVLGLGVKKEFSVGVVDLNYAMTRSKSSISYGYVDAAGALLGAPGAAIGNIGNAFPDMTYRLNSFQGSYLRPISKRLSLRVLARHEELRIADWHYTGLTPMLSSNTGGLLPVTYTDLGPRNYRATMVGVFLQYAM